MPNTSTVAEMAARHHLTEGAIQALAESLARSGGRAAQWNHPDLGGMGQWLPGGMLQIGDMFNHGLKARVAAALDDLSKAQANALSDVVPSHEGQGPGATWWPGDLGQPSSTGAQNDMRYACFPEARRLAVRQDGLVTVYDTGSRRLTGFAQSQGSSQTLEFSGPDGRVTLGELAVVT